MSWERGIVFVTTNNLGDALMKYLFLILISIISFEIQSVEQKSLFIGHTKEFTPLLHLKRQFLKAIYKFPQSIKSIMPHMVIPVVFLLLFYMEVLELVVMMNTLVFLISINGM